MAVQQLLGTQDLVGGEELQPAGTCPKEQENAEPRPGLAAWALLLLQPARMSVRGTSLELSAAASGVQKGSASCCECWAVGTRAVVAQPGLGCERIWSRALPSGLER